MRLTLVEILEATKGGQVGGTLVSNTFPTFHTDSREVEPGGVFFALEGAEMDGHQFVQDAIDRGAAAIIVERRVEHAHGVAQVLVPDGWAALYALATRVLERVSPLVVAVTGSNGKTSTKEMVAAVLGRRYKVHKTSRNLNTETGVPITILGLESDHTALVLEMGMQRAGEIQRLVALANPLIGVITNIGSVHLEFFTSQEQIARAKGELVAGLPRHGFAVLNADDDFFDLLTRLTVAKVASFGLESGDYRGSDYRVRRDGGCSFSVRGVDVRLALEGRHQARNALAALAAGECAGVTLGDGAVALAEVASVEHRFQEVRTPGGYKIVDDSYNASPESMVAAFETMSDRPVEGRRLAVLGEMRELGGAAADAHNRVGKRANEVFDAVCVIDSPNGRILADAAGAQLVSGRAEAAAWVRSIARPGDQVLVKASHGLRLDELVKELVT
jgi:UDP-N-acetylmuramoyl-tripeptide--D-alanyl-D-alanine ligase